MTCTSCEMRIENKLKNIEGVIEVKAIYSSSNVYITYDANILDVDKITEVIQKLDYKVKNNQQKNNVLEQSKEIKKSLGDKMPINQLLGIGIIIFALYLIIKNTIGFNFIPQVNQSTGWTSPSNAVWGCCMDM